MCDPFEEFVGELTGYLLREPLNSARRYSLTLPVRDPGGTHTGHAQVMVC